ncbi:hypothetical protein [Salininema proteolyticum]|uniref:Uncharacterized protein n=1 Tax=Salininema proteolyticum TaxID=1607685 RepID=A0ABV8U2M9_9ACTN
MPTVLKTLPLGAFTVVTVRRIAANILWLMVDHEFAGIVHLGKGWIRLCDDRIIPAADRERIRREAIAAGVAEEYRRDIPGQGGRR